MKAKKLRIGATEYRINIDGKEYVVNTQFVTGKQT